MSRVLVAFPLLVLVYALTLASFHPWDLAMGSGLAAAVLVGFRGFLFRELDRGAASGAGAPSLLARVAAFPLFALAVAWDIIRGTWQVAAVVLHVRPLRHPGIVAVPIGERTPVGVAVSALATTLSPGTFLVDVDWTARVMLIHVLDASDPDGVRAAHQQFYDRYQRRVFP